MPLMNLFRKWLLSLCLLLGLLWNVLCLVQVLPMENFRVSFLLLHGGMLIFFLSLLFSPPKEREPKPYQKMTAEERRFFAFLLCLSAAWLISTIACIVYPL